MTKEEFENNYWKQYLWIEKELVEILDFVELDQLNFSVFSRRMEKLLLQIGSEFDNVSREICGLQNVDRTNIADYCSYYTMNYSPQLFKTVIAYGNIQFTPFAGWGNNVAAKDIPFWKAYNSIKHDRIANCRMASLENTMNALAALFLVEMVYTDKLYQNDLDSYDNYPEEESKLFVLDGWERHVRPSKIKSLFGVFDDEDGGARMI